MCVCWSCTHHKSSQLVSENAVFTHARMSPDQRHRKPRNSAPNPPRPHQTTWLPATAISQTSFRRVFLPQILPLMARHDCIDARTFIVNGTKPRKRAFHGGRTTIFTARRLHGRHLALRCATVADGRPRSRRTSANPQQRQREQQTAPEELS